MVFSSLTFVAFFAIVLVLDRMLRSWTARKWHLLIASYLFYAAWNPPLLVLLWVSTCVDWFAAKGIYSARTPRARKAWLAATLATNFGLLGFFKYAGFFLDSLAAVLGACGVAYQPPALDVVLPPGISFYTFMTLSYTIDVYRREEKPWDSPLDLALLVSFFPHLVAGPILRAKSFHPQLVEPRRATSDQLGWGFALFTFGLFQKVVLADGFFAPVADEVFGKALRAGGVDAWMGTLAFSGQIFCDFAGYSTCAIGVALCLGFRLPENFDSPYGAIGFSDFWRRWHISLSSWLRDYLYIPLGGNRRGPVRTYVNLFLTMLIGGLWHGASWMFVIWGGLHGVYLAVERRLKEAFGEARWASTWPVTFGTTLLTYALVCIAWVFFRAPDMKTATHLTKVMLSGGKSSSLLGVVDYVVVGGLTIALLVAHGLTRQRSLAELWTRTPTWARIALLTVLLLTVTLSGGDNRAFIYFQF
ncbi:MAG: MBOAT family protein [Planctomycetes bacterium]|nr:MBOAT family protein [Planctomycetota bacterium]